MIAALFKEMKDKGQTAKTAANVLKFWKEFDDALLSPDWVILWSGSARNRRPRLLSESDFCPENLEAKFLEPSIRRMSFRPCPKERQEFWQGLWMAFFPH